MSEQTNIKYAHKTGSPWRGCRKKSEGCQNCYVEGFQRKFHCGLSDRRLVKCFEANVRKWNRLSPLSRPRIFPSLCDWLDDEVPIEWLADFLRVIHETPNLDWLLLTKRPEQFRFRLYRAKTAWEAEHGCDAFVAWIFGWLKGQPPNNVWFGVTCENQKRADERIPLLLQIPARVRWVSAEPLLEAIEFGAVPGGLVSPIYQDRRCKVDWLVVGGESGPKRRDCGVDAIVSVAEQCKAAGVPVWVKQDAAFKPGQQGRIPNEIWNRKELPRI